MHQIYFLNLFNRLFYVILLMSVQKTVYTAVNPFFYLDCTIQFFQNDFTVWVTGKFIKNTAIKCMAITIIRYSAQPYFLGWEWTWKTPGSSTDTITSYCWFGRAKLKYSDLWLLVEPGFLPKHFGNPGLKQRNHSSAGTMMAIFSQ